MHSPEEEPGKLCRSGSKLNVKAKKKKGGGRKYVKIVFK